MADRHLEEKIKERKNVPHAICMPRARTGIYFAIKAMIQPGQKVILSPYTISDVINMVLCAGGKPVFADIDPVTNNIDASQIDTLIDDETGAVLITHLHGYACDMERIAEICRRKKVPLVEDAAQAFGASYQSKAAGAIGDAGIFSFGTYKNVNTFLGGMVVSTNRNTYKLIKQEMEKLPPQNFLHYIPELLTGFATDIATYPLLFKCITFWIFRWAYLNDIDIINNRVTIDRNPERKESIPGIYLKRMTSLQAQLALFQIENVDKDSDARIHFAGMYHEGLRDIEELVIAPFHADRRHIYTYYAIQAPDRHALVRRLMQEGCDVAISHHKNCADLPAFKEFYRDCPNARNTAKNLIYLPTYPRFSEKQAREIVRIIRKFFHK